MAYLFGAVTVLASSDYRRMLDFLRVALENEGHDPFPEPVLAALRVLIPSASAAYMTWDDRRSSLQLAAEEPARVLDVWDGYCEVSGQDPLRGPAPGERPVVPIGRAIRMSDVISPRAYRKLDLYERMARPLGVGYVMKLYFPTRIGSASVVLDRGVRDFSDRDRDVLNGLLPHLEALRRRAGAYRTRRVESDACGVLTMRERQVLRLVAAGYTNPGIAATLYIARGTVRKHLDNIYAKLGVANRSEAVARLFDD
jgi:DNA-binding CsgD family transcriptional regulator